MSERYEIRRKIGQGGVGAVYHAFDTKLQRNVALKRMLPLKESRANTDAAKGLEKEASIISSLQNPNIITVYDAGSDEEGSFVVMELIEGQTLDKIVRRAALRVNDFVPVVEQSLGGLIAAQSAGLLHRDLKPKNIMVSWLPSGNFQLKILDFGLAKFSVQPTFQTVDHGDNILGSIHFMAPEQFERLHLDPRTDLYAMGCVYYFSLTQQYPFTGENPAEVMSSHLHHNVKPISEFRPDLGTGYCEWIMRLISRNPDDRPADARAALREFQAIDATTGSAPPRSVAPVPLAMVIPELGAAPTSSITGPTGPITAAQRAGGVRKDEAPGGGASRKTGSSTGVTVVRPSTGTAPTRQWLPSPRAGKAILFTACALVPVIALVVAVSRYNHRFGSDSGGGPHKPTIPPLPMSEHRVAHYAAHVGVVDPLAKPAQVKSRVALWRDIAADVSGENTLRNLSENESLMPTLDLASTNAGLNDRHAILRFRKGAELTATRVAQDDHEALGTSLDGQELTWFIVFKPSANAGAHLVAAIDQRAHFNAAVTWYRQQAYQTGVRPKDKAADMSIAPCNFGSFILLTFVWDGSRGEQFQNITLPDGTRIPGTLASVDSAPLKVQRLRIGGTKSDRVKGSLLFGGDIAEFIVYNKALPDRDISAVETYLFRKYFGN